MCSRPHATEMTRLPNRAGESVEGGCSGARGRAVVGVCRGARGRAAEGCADVSRALSRKRKRRGQRTCKCRDLLCGLYISLIAVPQRIAAASTEREDVAAARDCSGVLTAAADGYDPGKTGDARGESFIGIIVAHGPRPPRVEHSRLPDRGAVEFSNRSEGDGLQEARDRAWQQQVCSGIAVPESCRRQGGNGPRHICNKSGKRKPRAERARR